MLCLAITSALQVALPPGSFAAQRASLDISPNRFVGGQAVTFAGNIGKKGVRNIHLQTHMARPGDRWVNLAGSGAKTQANGDFRFKNIAPSMFGIKVRVVSGSLATPAVTFNAKSQDLTMWATSGLPGVEDNQVLAGAPFRVRVDTTPQFRPRRADLPPPAFPGRELTLQKRVNGDEWNTVATTTVDDDGTGTFNAVSEFQPGRVFYRVRQENWTKGGSKIGWFPSFPTAVRVLADLPTRVSGAAKSSPSTRTVTSGGEQPFLARSPGGTTASGKYRWGRSLWDFAWEFGESLTSRPYRGSDPRGRWIDASTGSGRVSKHNGGLSLDSQREFKGPGDFGTTSATLRGNPMKYGRWETKLRLKSPERGEPGGDYRVRIELIPENPSDYHCGAQNITVADLAPHGRSVKVGVKTRSNNRQWTRSKRIGSLLDGGLAAFAVEVSKKHISWFVNGRVIGTVRGRSAVSDVPLTLRFSLVGKGTQEMNRAQSISDWQRGFSLGPGRLVTSGSSLKRGTHGGGC